MLAHQAQIRNVSYYENFIKRAVLGDLEHIKCNEMV